jgi:hypothetical protein
MVIGFYLDDRTAPSCEQQGRADQIGRHVVHASVEKGSR